MITPMDIHNKTFSKSLRGYSEEEVNDFLRQIVTDYEQIYREHREMEEQMDQMKTKLANYEKISETMTNTLQLAKDTAENVKKNAKRNADILIANAHQEGKRTIRDAEESRRRLMENMIRTEETWSSPWPPSTPWISWKFPPWQASRHWKKRRKNRLKQQRKNHRKQHRKNRQRLQKKQRNRLRLKRRRRKLLQKKRRTPKKSRKNRLKKNRKPESNKKNIPTSWRGCFLLDSVF